MSYNPQTDGLSLPEGWTNLFRIKQIRLCSCFLLLISLIGITMSLSELLSKSQLLQRCNDLWVLLLLLDTQQTIHLLASCPFVLFLDGRKIHSKSQLWNDQRMRLCSCSTEKRNYCDCLCEINERLRTTTKEVPGSRHVSPLNNNRRRRDTEKKNTFQVFAPPQPTSPSSSSFTVHSSTQR